MKNNNLTYPNIIRTFCCGFFILLMGSCEKEQALDDKDAFVISTSTDQSQIIEANMDVSVEGGRDTIFVFSNYDFEYVFQTKESEEWLTIVQRDYLADIGATRLILEIAPLEEAFGIRSGVMSITNQAHLAGKFFRISQGYISRYSESFTWLKYGVPSPLDEGREVMIQGWNNTQAAYGWTSTVAAGAEAAYIYGRFEHVKLGNETNGADLISPIIGGIEKDSLLLLTFHAVSFVSMDGTKDVNKLTIELQNGCQFEDGSTVVTVDLPYYDHQSPLIATKMWHESLQILRIKKPDLNTVISTLRLKFLTGEGLSSAMNRVYLDNIQLYSVAQFEK